MIAGVVLLELNRDTILALIEHPSQTPITRPRRLGRHSLIPHLSDTCWFHVLRHSLIPPLRQALIPHLYDAR